MYLGTEYTGISIQAITLLGASVFALSLLMIVCRWRIFQKAEFAGWQSLVPFLSMYRSVEIACGSGWKMVFLLVPVINVIYLLAIAHKTSMAFGYGIGLTLLLIFARPVGLFILAYGNNDYFGPY